MKATIKNALLLLFASGVIYLTGCSKSSAANTSITGTWNYTGYTQSTYTNTTQPHDTSVSTTDGTLTLSSSGTFISSFNSSLSTEPLNLFALNNLPGSGYTISGSYTYSNSTLTFSDPQSLNTNVPYGGTVTTFTAHALSIQQIDTFNSGTSPATYVKFTFNYSR